MSGDLRFLMRSIIFDILNEISTLSMHSITLGRNTSLYLYIVI